jgi:hypothetical protein
VRLYFSIKDLHCKLFILKSLFITDKEESMAAKSHSFSTNTVVDTAFVEKLKITERQAGRANFSWVVVKALRDYANKVEQDNERVRAS